MHPVTITLSPPGIRTEYRWLFDNLERVYPVRFVTRDRAGEAAGAPAILFADAWPTDIPRAAHSLVYLMDANAAVCRQEIVFTRADALDRRLQGRTLEERSLPPLRALEGIPGEPLALCAGHAVWVRQHAAAGGLDIVRLPRGEHLKERMLWDNLQEHRFFFLMTLVHYLYSVLAASGWTPPPLRAAFIVDDPNFRSARYGFLRFPDVARTARAERFHLAIASAPIDLAATSRRMARFLADHTDVLSVCIHGNDHTHHELLLADTEQAALPLLTRMLRRVEDFERRFRIPVSRVVVPPNEMCSAATLRALRRLPIAAVCTSRPWPWLPGDSWADTAGPEDGLLCWPAGDFVEGGASVIRRSAIPNNMLFRAFLNQPVIRYFHQGDFKGEMELPRRAAEEINALGGVRWMPLGELAATNYEARIQGSTMFIRPFSRRVRVAVPEPVTTLVPDLALLGSAPCRIAVSGKGGPCRCEADAPLAVIPGTVVDLGLEHPDPVDPQSCTGGRTSVVAWAHRRVSETADRLRLRR